jgi:hypothetical protein
LVGSLKNIRLGLKGQSLTNAPAYNSEVLLLIVKASDDHAHGKTIEIGLEHACFVVLVYFFPHLNNENKQLIMGPNNTKNCSLNCDFLIFNYE